MQRFIAAIIDTKALLDSKTFSSKSLIELERPATACYFAKAGGGHSQDAAGQILHLLQHLQLRLAADVPEWPPVGHVGHRPLEGLDGIIHINVTCKVGGVRKWNNCFFLEI